MVIGRVMITRSYSHCNNAIVTVAHHIVAVIMLEMNVKEIVVENCWNLFSFFSASKQIFDQTSIVIKLDTRESSTKLALGCASVFWGAEMCKEGGQTDGLCRRNLVTKLEWDTEGIVVCYPPRMVHPITRTSGSFSDLLQQSVTVASVEHVD